MQRLYILLGVGIVGVLGYLSLHPRITLKKGDQAPAFTAIDSEGVERSLDEFKGKYVVLYFFPKSNSPGCTKQACSLRDNYEPFKEMDVVVLGMSYDSPQALKSFKEEHHLPFILLSDADKKVAALYGAARPIFSNIAPHRVTFIIDEQGNIAEVMPSVSVDTHTVHVIESIKRHKGV